MGDDNDNEERKETNWIQRRTAWTTLMAFSAIALGAFLSSEWDRGSARHKWVIAAMSTSTAFSFFAWIAHRMAKHAFLGKWEGATAALVLAVWAGALPVIMGPSNDIAVTGFVIKDANIYFFSWLSAFAACFVCAGVAEYDLDATNPQMRKWYIFTFAAIVVMTSSTRHYRDAKKNDYEWEADGGKSWERRVKFGIGIGAGGAFIGFLAIVMAVKDKLSNKVEAGFALVLLLMFAVGVSLITFGGAKGPGTTIGNLYFSTWICFAESLFLCSTATGKLKADKSAASEEQAEEAEEKDVEAGDDKKAEEPPEAPVEVTQEATSS